MALRRYCQTIAHTQMVNVFPEQFFATTYGLGVRAQKVSYWPVFRDNKLSPVAQSLYGVTTLPAYKSSLPRPIIVRFSNNVRNDVQFLSAPRPLARTPLSFRGQVRLPGHYYTSKLTTAVLSQLLRDYSLWICLLYTSPSPRD